MTILTNLYHFLKKLDLRLVFIFYFFGVFLFQSFYLKNRGVTNSSVLEFFFFCHKMKFQDGSVKIFLRMLHNV